jgi:hypothetical protein
LSIALTRRSDCTAEAEEMLQREKRGTTDPATIEMIDRTIELLPFILPKNGIIIHVEPRRELVMGLTAPMSETRFKIEHLSKIGGILCGSHCGARRMLKV